MSALKILCYGDSNTWGQVAFEERQIPESNRWTFLLSKLVDAEVVAESFCGRIAGNYETAESGRNGQDPYANVVQHQLPLDFIIIALGTNDLKKRYSRTTQDLVDDLLWYGSQVKDICLQQNTSIPRLIYLTPPNFNAPRDYFDGDETLRTSAIDTLSKQVNTVVINNLELSEDGVHISSGDHVKIANELTKKIKELI